MFHRECGKSVDGVSRHVDRICIVRYMVTSRPKEINTFIPQSGITRSDFAIDTFSVGRYNIRTNPAYTEGWAFGLDAAYAELPVSFRLMCIRRTTVGIITSI